MTSYHELDQLSSQELHDRATHRAIEHLDVKYFWQLLETIPIAETVARDGDARESADDIQHPSALLHDATQRDPKLVDALRPLYLDYLTKHPDA